MTSGPDEASTMMWSEPAPPVHHGDGAGIGQLDGDGVVASAEQKFRHLDGRERDAPLERQVIAGVRWAYPGRTEDPPGCCPCRNR